MAAVKPMLIGVGAQAITGGVQKSSTASSYFDRVLSFSGLRELADSAANGEGQTRTFAATSSTRPTLKGLTFQPSAIWMM